MKIRNLVYVSILYCLSLCGAGSDAQEEEKKAAAATTLALASGNAAKDDYSLSRLADPENPHTPPEIAVAVKPFVRKSVQDLLQEYAESEQAMDALRANSKFAHNQAHLVETKLKLSVQEKEQQNRLLALKYHKLNRPGTSEAQRIEQLFNADGNRALKVTEFRKRAVHKEFLARSWLDHVRVPLSEGSEGYEYFWQYIGREKPEHGGKKPAGEATRDPEFEEILMEQYGIHKKDVDKRVNDLFSMLGVDGIIKNGYVVDIAEFQAKVEAARSPSGSSSPSPASSPSTSSSTSPASSTVSSSATSPASSTPSTPRSSTSTEQMLNCMLARILD